MSLGQIRKPERIRCMFGIHSVNIVYEEDCSLGHYKWQHQECKCCGKQRIKRTKSAWSIDSSINEGISIGLYQGFSGHKGLTRKWKYL